MHLYFTYTIPAAGNNSRRKFILFSEKNIAHSIGYMMRERIFSIFIVSGVFKCFSCNENIFKINIYKYNALIAASTVIYQRCDTE